MGFTKGQNVFVSSIDVRHEGFNATITSIGSKYITVTNTYGVKYRFDKERFYCIEWSIYHLEESESSYKERMLRERKLLTIIRNKHSLGDILLDNEINDIYNRIIQKFGE